jgi:demethylmenaquinone methyltransferase/2-methoxy-6-polyprenyl-1,4-benzoquinol methylase
MNSDYSGRPLHQHFSAIPRHYDLINRLFTWRMDELWRKDAVREISRFHPATIMDLCTGTGDLAIRISNNSGKDAKITGFDYSLPMLEIARRKSIRKGQGRIEFIHGDAANMPFPDHYFDAIGIAFAFRNLTYKNPETHNFLKEILRVLKPGGCFVIVESSQPKNPVLRKLFRIYTQNMVYRLGSIISGNRGAYRYLSASVINFYSPNQICEILLSAGFREVTFKRLLGGIAALHVAIR